MRGLAISRTVQTAFIVIGMATAWLPVLDRLLYPVSFTFSNSGDDTAYLFHIIYSVLVISISLAIGVVAHRSKREPFNNAKTVLFAGFCGSAGIGIVAALDFSSPLAMALMGVGVAFVALYVPVHYLFWSCCLTRLSAKRAVTDAALSFALASLAFALTTAMNTSILPIEAASPAVSGALGFAYLHCDRAKTERPAEGEMKPPLNETIVAVSLVLVLLCNIAVAYFNNSARLQADLPYRTFTAWGQVLVFGLIAYLYLPDRAPKQATMSSFAVASLTFIAMLFVAVFVSDAVLNIGSVPLNCANSILTAFCWLLLVRDANRKRENASWVMALFLALVVLLPRFAQACIMYRSNFITLFAQSIQYLYVVAAIVFLSVCLIVSGLFRTFAGANGDRLNASQKSGTAQGDNDALEPAIEEAYLADARRAAQYEKALQSLRGTAGLSNREVDVARLALKNYGAKKMAEELFISENTVYSHLKHIYQKTGVHSKQEFIEYVEEHLPEH